VASEARHRFGFARATWLHQPNKSLRSKRIDLNKRSKAVSRCACHRTPKMTEQAALVVTSISSPNNALKSLARGAQEHGLAFIVIGDESSPANFHLEGCRYYSLNEQRNLCLELAQLSPPRHYARKNVGYLLALKGGASMILETDDDNLPEPSFWAARQRQQSVSTAQNTGWLNVYRYFSDVNIWPRGFPLEHIQSPPPDFESLSNRTVDCPIQQGLANDNPDVDAIYRLVFPLPHKFRADRRVAFMQGAWCPFNSQNTCWWRDAFPLMYLPAYCSFRMTDIWRSLVAQRVAWANDWAILFHEPTVVQKRNDHNLLRDFKDEVPGYLNNDAIREGLEQVTMKPGVEQLGENLRVCYEKLVSMKLVEKAELTLVDAWLNDLRSIGFRLIHNGL
jgi:hypothetical protein